MAALTLASRLVCPHGGTVVVVTFNTRVQAAGTPMLTSSDLFLVVGCPLTLGPAPSPCLTVQWLASDRKSKLAGGTTLSTASVGICKAASGGPQGTVAVAANQGRAS
jgi:hypothetical protein